MPPFRKSKPNNKNLKNGKKSLTTKSKSNGDNKEPRKTTIGPALISNILDTRKMKIDGIEISKIAYENLKNYVKEKGGMPIEQAIATLVEQKFNPRFTQK